MIANGPGTPLSDLPKYPAMHDAFTYCTPEAEWFAKIAADYAALPWWRRAWLRLTLPYRVWRSERAERMLP